jgi:hypothetical protein
MLGFHEEILSSKIGRTSAAAAHRGKPLPAAAASADCLVRCETMSLACCCSSAEPLPAAASALDCLVRCETMSLCSLLQLSTVSRCLLQHALTVWSVAKR